MNINTMPLEAETRVLINRSLENLGWKLNGKTRMYIMNSRKLKQKRKNSKVKDLIMSFILRKVINRLLLLKRKRKDLELILLWNKA